MTVPTPSAARPATAPRAGGLFEVFDLAYPVVLTQLSHTAMGVIDSAMVGRLGATELAAVGFASVWLWTLFSLFYGTASGIQTFVAQADGAGEPRRCGAWVWQGAWAVVPVAALVVSALLPAMPTIVAWLGPSEALQESAVAYVTARLPGEICLAAMVVPSAFFRGIGDTRTPLYVTLAATALNVVLDYGLIFGELGLPRWGVAGAGAATAFANAFAAAALLAALRRRALRERYDTRIVAPRPQQIRRFLRTGAPIGAEWCIGMTSFATFTTLVARMGDASMAASQSFVMLLSLSFMQALGISMAAATLVGRYVGAGDLDAARRSFRSSLGLGAAVGTAVALLFVLIPGTLLRIFTDDPEVVALGAPLLVLGALFQLFDAAAIITQGALRGAGDTRWPFVVHTLLAWGLFVPLAYALGVVWGGGLTGAWLGGLVYVALHASVLVWRFRSGAWRDISI